MKKIFVLLLVAVFMLSACKTQVTTDNANQQPDTGNAEGQETAPGSTSDDSEETMPEEADDAEENNAFGFANLYNYDAAHSWTYSINAAGFESTVTTEIESSTYEGKSAWKLTSSSEMQGGSTATTVYSDKSTGACLYAKTEMNVAGYANVQEGCPENDTQYAGSSDSGSAADMPSLVNVGTESVTVGAGTFMATVYELKKDSYSSKYYYNSNVPVPLKVMTTAGSVSTTMELESYS